jgi:RNA polymerase sigma factor (sigma-70 family)
MAETIATVSNSLVNTGSTSGGSISQRPGAYSHLVDNINTLLSAARPRLLHLVQGQGVRQDAADDVVQETLVEAWQHLANLRDPARFDAWLNGICRNVSLRWLRSHGMTTKQQVAFSDLSFDDHEDIEPVLPATDAFDPAEDLERQDMQVMLDHALGYLPDSTRQAVELCYLAELPQREAALRLGMTIHALEERLYRARRQLRQLLNNELRTDAASFGLIQDQGAVSGTRETRIWCPFCAQHRQLGILESRPDGTGYLRTWCPSCCMRPDINLCTHKEMYGLRAFRPALKRLDLLQKSSLPQALVDGHYPCERCGQMAKPRLVKPFEPFGPYRDGCSHPHHILALECSYCGHASSTWACGFSGWFHPALKVFIEQHPRWIMEPESVTEYSNHPALRSSLRDVTSNARLIVFSHYETLQPLAIFQE